MLCVKYCSCRTVLVAVAEAYPCFSMRSWLCALFPEWRGSLNCREKSIRPWRYGFFELCQPTSQCRMLASLIWVHSFLQIKKDNFCQSARQFCGTIEFMACCAVSDADDKTSLSVNQSECKICIFVECASYLHQRSYVVVSFLLFVIRIMQKLIIWFKENQWIGGTWATAETMKFLVKICIALCYGSGRVWWG